MAGRTIVDLWRDAVDRDATNPAFLANEGRSWREVGWREADERIEELAAGFLALGLVKGDKVAILSRTRLEWTLCDYALASIGAVIVPIYHTNSPEECRYVVADSAARALICEDAEQLEKTAGFTDEVPSLEFTFAFEAAAGGAIAIEDVAARGRAYAAENGGALAEARARVSAADVLTYIYTSGTTGDPKGCVLTHGNWVAVLEGLHGVEDLIRDDDIVLLFLPLAHNFARLVQFAGSEIGFTLAFVADVNRVARALGEVRPTVFPSVPRLYERVYTTLRGRFDHAEGFQRRVAQWALRVGRRAAKRRAEGKRPGPLLAAQLRLADRLVFSKVKERFGGRLRHGVSGGAPLSAEIIEFFAACGILVLEGYGLTETTSAVSVNRPAHYRFGTVGHPIPGVEIALAEDDEIKVRGPGLFQGYYGKDEATAEVLTSDGWLLTGDIGTIDDDGFVTITDRKKELIVTAGGKKISPSNLENQLIASDHISTAFVVGDNRSYLAALVYPNPEIEKVAPTETEQRELIQKVIDEVNAHHGPVEQIHRFSLLPRDFLAEEGEITPTLKVKRKVVEQHFRDDIERLYRREPARA
jgi:long-chain acyl-CoA synthetase